MRIGQLTVPVCLEFLVLQLVDLAGSTFREGESVNSHAPPQSACTFLRQGVLFPESIFRKRFQKDEIRRAWSFHETCKNSSAALSYDDRLIKGTTTLLLRVCPGLIVLKPSFPGSQRIALPPGWTEALWNCVATGRVTVWVGKRKIRDLFVRFSPSDLEVLGVVCFDDWVTPPKRGMMPTFK